MDLENIKVDSKNDSISVSKSDKTDSKNIEEEFKNDSTLVSKGDKTDLENIEEDSKDDSKIQNNTKDDKVNFNDISVDNESKNIFESLNTDPESYEVIEGLDEEEQELRKYCIISDNAHLITRQETQTLLDKSLKEVYDFFKNLPGFSDNRSENDKRFVNPKYFKKIDEKEKIRYVFDTNIFISHHIIPYDVPVRFSKTVMFEIMKLNKFTSAYRKFFDFFFMSIDVKFPDVSFSKLRPTFYDEEILKELSESDILVSEDIKLRSKRGKNSMNFSQFRSMNPKRSKGTVTFSPSASLFFTKSFNWSLKPVKVQDYHFYIDPVMAPGSYNNSIVTFKNEFSTPINLPDENPDTDFFDSSN